MNLQGLEQRKAGLIAEITAAFDGVQREDGVTLHEAWALDLYRAFDDPTDSIRVEARAKDTESRWQEVPSEDISQGDGAFYFFDPNGFRYYIPAYLIWYLTSEEESNTYDHVDFFLDRDFLAESNAHYLSHVSLLTFEQSKAIAHFLKFQLGFLAKQANIWQLESDEIEKTRLEEHMKTEFEDGPMSPEECEAARQEMRDCLANRAPLFAAQNAQAQSALDRYWGKFL